MKKCYICNKYLNAKNISKHYRLMHKNSDYCSQVTRGMTFTNNINNPNVFMTQNNYYCPLCKKIMKKQSKYHHNKSLLHQILKNKNSKSNNIFKVNYKKQDLNNQAIINKKNLPPQTDHIIPVNDNNINKNDFIYEKEEIDSKNNVKDITKENENIHKHIAENINLVSKDNNIDSYNAFLFYSNLKYDLGFNSDKIEYNKFNNSITESEVDSSSDLSFDSELYIIPNMDNSQSFETDKDKKIKEEIEYIIQKIEYRKKQELNLKKRRNKEYKKEKRAFQNKNK